MDKNEIIEGNKLIAFSIFSDEDIRNWVNDTDTNKPDNFYLKILTYHSDYNQLMHVIEKIEYTYHPKWKNENFKVHIIENICYIDLELISLNGLDGYTRVCGNNKLDAIWLAVVNFITWYNSYALNY